MYQSGIFEEAKMFSPVEDKPVVKELKRLRAEFELIPADKIDMRQCAMDAICGCISFHLHKPGLENYLNFINRLKCLGVTFHDANWLTDGDSSYVQPCGHLAKAEALQRFDTLIAKYSQVEGVK